METLIIFLGFVAWSAAVFIAGMYIGAKNAAFGFIKLFDKERLKSAYIGRDKSNKIDIENELNIHPDPTKPRRKTCP
jgi:hypothetical protein